MVADVQRIAMGDLAPARPPHPLSIRPLWSRSFGELMLLERMENWPAETNEPLVRLSDKLLNFTSALDKSESAQTIQLDTTYGPCRCGTLQGMATGPDGGANKLEPRRPVVGASLRASIKNDDDNNDHGGTIVLDRRPGPHPTTSHISLLTTTVWSRPPVVETGQQALSRPLLAGTFSPLAMSTQIGFADYFFFFFFFLLQ